MEVSQAAGHALCHVTQLAPGHRVALQMVRQRALHESTHTLPKQRMNNRASDSCNPGTDCFWIHFICRLNNAVWGNYYNKTKLRASSEMRIKMEKHPSKQMTHAPMALSGTKYVEGATRTSLKVITATMWRYVCGSGNYVLILLGDINSFCCEDQWTGCSGSLEVFNHKLLFQGHSLLFWR